MGEAIRRGRINVLGQPTDAFVVEFSARRTLVMAVLSAMFGLIGIFMIVAGDTGQKVIGAISLLFFGGGAVVLASQVRRPGRWALTRHGLYGESRFASAFAPWEAIVGIGRVHLTNTEMLAVEVGDPAQITTSRGLGWLKGINRSMGYPDLAIPTSLLGSRTEALERGIAFYVAEPEARERIGTASELERLNAAIGIAGPSDDGRPTVKPDTPVVARVLLWLSGALGLLITLVALLSEPEAGRESARLVGAAVFGGTSVAALGSAFLLTRRPLIGKILGFVAAAGGLFLGWVVVRNASELPGALVGIAIAATGLIVAWQLVRWAPQRVSRA
ncbi:MAG TPA: STM3941 family protein [Candidatus Limnocylindrales bacterium]|nr:STM3941 family protein [Candidatus Limnocylindrales bacterium]